VHDAFFDTNRRAWDERAALHRRDRTGFYAVEAFRAGQDILYPIEAAEIGGVEGLELAHLQCHFGLDTLTLARRGAIATGLDFSPTAIAAARALAAESGLAAQFVEGNVHDAPLLLGQGRFAVVYVTWGALPWLPDMRRWARVVASLLRPGGFLYLAETHPFLTTLEEEDGRLVARHDWRTRPEAPLAYDASATYTGDEKRLANTRNYEWQHPLSEIVGSLVEAGLRLDFRHEHETLPWRPFPMMVEVGERMFRLPDGQPRLPLAVSLKASRP
jgi:SAM-dependent methyltransferase